MLGRDAVAEEVRDVASRHDQHDSPVGDDVAAEQLCEIPRCGIPVDDGAVPHDAQQSLSDGAGEHTDDLDGWVRQCAADASACKLCREDGAGEGDTACLQSVIHGDVDGFFDAVAVPYGFGKGDERRDARCAGGDDSAVCCVIDEGVDRARLCDAACGLVVDVSLAYQFLGGVGIADAWDFALGDPLAHDLNGILILVARHLDLHGLTVGIQIAILSVTESGVDRGACIRIVFRLDELSVHHAVGSRFRIVIAENARIPPVESVDQVICPLCGIAVPLPRVEAHELVAVGGVLDGDVCGRRIGALLVFCLLQHVAELRCVVILFHAHSLIRMKITLIYYTTFAQKEKWYMV